MADITFDLRQATAGVRPRPNIGQWLVARYIYYLPVLWVLGVYVPAGMAMLLYLARRWWPRGVLINSVIFTWIAIGVIQAICSLLFGLTSLQLPEGVRAMTSIRVYGWIMGGLAIGIGYSYRLSSQQFIRAVSVLGGLILVMIGVILVTIGQEDYSFLTPFGMILPHVDFVDFYATGHVWVMDDDNTEIRLSILAPWAVSTGVTGAGIVLISYLDRDIRWRLIGIIGGLAAVILSHSRIMIAALAVVTAALVFMRLNSIVKSLLLTVIVIGFVSVYLSGIDPIQYYKDAQEEADALRPGSSQARDQIYEANWQGFWKSPIIGNGWTGQSTNTFVEAFSKGPPNAPAGSHSSFSGLAYTGGVLTLGMFVVSMIVTLSAMSYAVLKTPFGSEARRYTLVGLGLVVALLMLSPYDGLFSDTISSVILFLFIGGAIRVGQKHEI